MSKAVTYYPEVVFFNIIKNSLEFLREDYELHKNEPEKSLLIGIIGINKYQRYDMAQQAVSVFIIPKNNNEPRFLDINMGFDSKRIGKGIPSMHMIVQNDSPKDDSLGIGSGNVMPDFYEEESEYRNYHERSYTGQINVLISGDNSNEKVLIYYVMKSLLTSFIPHITDVYGFRNISISGNEIQINTGVAGNMFMRNLSIKYDYSMNMPELENRKIIDKIFYQLDVVDNGRRIKVAEFGTEKEEQ